MAWSRFNGSDKEVWERWCPDKRRTADHNVEFCVLLACKFVPWQRVCVASAWVTRVSWNQVWKSQTDGDEVGFRLWHVSWHRGPPQVPLIVELYSAKMQKTPKPERAPGRETIVLADSDQVNQVWNECKTFRLFSFLEKLINAAKMSTEAAT